MLCAHISKGFEESVFLPVTGSTSVTTLGLLLCSYPPPGWRGLMDAQESSWGLQCSSLWKSVSPRRVLARVCQRNINVLKVNNLMQNAHLVKSGKRAGHGTKPCVQKLLRGRVRCKHSSTDPASTWSCHKNSSGTQSLWSKGS